MGIGKVVVDKQPKKFAKKLYTYWFIYVKIFTSKTTTCAMSNKINQYIVFLCIEKPQILYNYYEINERGML